MFGPEALQPQHQLLKCQRILRGWQRGQSLGEYERGRSIQPSKADPSRAEVPPGAFSNELATAQGRRFKTVYNLFFLQATEESMTPLQLRQHAGGHQLFLQVALDNLHQKFP